MSKAPGKNAAARRKNQDQAVQNLKSACTFEDSEEEPRKKHLRKTVENMSQVSTFRLNAQKNHTSSQTL